MKNLTLIYLMLFTSLIASAQPFRFIVAADGTGTHTTIQAALDACPDAVQSLIFVKNGTYNEQISLGSKTTASTKKISLIGESANAVIITHSQSRAATGSPTFEEVCTVKIYATDFYAENITIQNTAGNTGMAEALYTAGDRQTFKNCRILGYQDTYRSKKGTRGYFKNCWIEGATDFIYAGGTLFLDDCTINCVNGGGYIAAPEDAYATIPKASTVSQKFIRLGFIFRNCSITANKDVTANSYTLGRPWNTTAGAFYLNCKMGSHIKSVGWTAMGGNETSACFAEYNSKDLNGNQLDMSGRISWSFQLPQADVDNLLTPAYVYGVSYTTTFDPINLCVSPTAPTNVSISGNVIFWDAVSGAAGYLVYKNNKFQAAVAETSYANISGESGIYSVTSISSLGVLSSPTSLTAVSTVNESGVKINISGNEISFSEPVIYTIYNLNGTRIATSTGFVIHLSTSNFSKGVYLLQLLDENKKERKLKIDLP
jgi:pectin methylesterase-like acyl-CoA thioesterase